MKNNIYTLIIGCAVAVFSCTTAQAFAQTPQQSDTSMIAADTTAVLVDSTITAPISMLEANKDSVRQILQRLDSQRISGFQTFSGKAKINCSALPVSVTANIHIQEDSIIWISFTASMVITAEVARAKITRDSVIIMDKWHKNVVRRSFAYLQTLTKVPFTFEDVQDIILGNPLLTRDTTFLSGSKGEGYLEDVWDILVGNDTLSNIITVEDKNDSTLLLTHSFLQDSTAAGNHMCDMMYDNYQPINNGQNGQYFSQTRNITVTDNNSGQQIQATMQFSSFNFGVPVDFPFNIPDNYSEQ